MDKIAIIGSGHVGTTLLCDFILRIQKGAERTKLLSLRHGNQRLAPPNSDIDFCDVLMNKTHRIQVDENNYGALFSISSLRWLNESTYIVITVPDIPYLRPILIEYLVRNVDMKGKILIFCRGGQAGTPFLSQLIHKEKRLHDTHTIMIEDSFYGTRAQGNTVRFKRKYQVNISYYSRDGKYAMKMLRDIFPKAPNVNAPSWPHFAIKPALELLFDPLGYIIHVGVAFYDKNLQKTEKGKKYKHYTEGIDKTLAKKLTQLDQERVEIAGRFGVETETYPQIIARQYKKAPIADFYEMMQSCQDIYKSESAGNMKNLLHSRYISEDLPALFTMIGLAEISGFKAKRTHEYCNEIRAQMRRYHIDENHLSHYVHSLSEISSREQLTRIMNNPIPET